MHATRLLAQRLPEAGRSDDDRSAHRPDVRLADVRPRHRLHGCRHCDPVGHAISARFHIDNGITNAIVLPHVVRFNAEAAVRGLEKLATAFGRPANGAEAVLRRDRGDRGHLR